MTAKTTLLNIYSKNAKEWKIFEQNFLKSGNALKMMIQKPGSTKYLTIISEPFMSLYGALYAYLYFVNNFIGDWSELF